MLGGLALFQVLISQPHMTYSCGLTIQPCQLSPWFMHLQLYWSSWDSSACHAYFLKIVVFFCLAHFNLVSAQMSLLQACLHTPCSLTIWLCIMSLWNLSSEVVLVVVCHLRAEVRTLRYTSISSYCDKSPVLWGLLLCPFVTGESGKELSLHIFLISLGFSLSYNGWVKAHELFFVSFYKYCQILL